MSYAQNRHEVVVRRVEEVAADLRAASQKIVRISIKLLGDDYTSLHDLKPDHGQAAHDVLHTVSWMIANLQLGELAKVAAEADVAARAIVNPEPTDDREFLQDDHDEEEY